jgi:hypothetical protein
MHDYPLPINDFCRLCTTPTAATTHSRKRKNKRNAVQNSNQVLVNGETNLSNIDTLEKSTNAKTTPKKLVNFFYCMIERRYSNFKNRL